MFNGYALELFILLRSLAVFLRTLRNNHKIALALPLLDLFHRQRCVEYLPGQESHAPIVECELRRGRTQSTSRSPRGGGGSVYVGIAIITQGVESRL